MILSVLVAFLFSLSITIQKGTIKKDTKIIKMLTNKKWLLGSFVGAIGFVLYIYELSIEKLIIVQPIVASTIVFAIILEVVLLKNKISKIEIIASLLAFVGIILIGVF